MANHLAMAAAIEHGDEVLIEQPTYEPLLALAQYFGANIKRFARLAEGNYGVDLDDLASQVTSRTRLIVLTNLHNPSSALVDEDTLRRIGEIAQSAGARVLVDEVYLEAMFEVAPRSSAHLGPQFIASSSLTKGYGLSGLRCGWILAEPGLARAIWRLNDLFASTPAHPADLISVVAFEHLDRIRERAHKVVETDRVLLGKFLDEEESLSAPRTAFGTTAFLRLKKGNAEEFLLQLRTNYETTAVPGRFFEMPNHFRIGMGVDSEMFGEGLRRIGLALAS